MAPLNNIESKVVLIVAKDPVPAVVSIIFVEHRLDEDKGWRQHDSVKDKVEVTKGNLGTHTCLPDKTDKDEYK